MRTYKAFDNTAEDSAFTEDSAFDEEIASSDEEQDLAINDKMALDIDASSGFIFALIRYSSQEMHDRDGKLPLAVSLGVQAFLAGVILFLQFYISLIMYVFVIERREDPFEHNLKEGSALLRESLASGIPIDATDNSLGSATLMKCWKDHSVRWSETIILFIWFVKAGDHVVKAIWSTWVTFKLPVLNARQIVKHGPDDETFIDGFTPCLRFVVVGLVNVPRVCVMLGVTFVGAKFLEFASSVSVLVMKSLALAFISTLDSVIFTALAPRKFIASQQKACFRYHTEQSEGNWVLWGSLNTVVKMVFYSFCALFLSRILFHHVHEFRSLCTDYEYEFHDHPRYKTWWKNQINCTTCGFTVFGETFRN